jgi:predicted  nucleic acid-binding Zn-ribbon protein
LKQRIAALEVGQSYEATKEAVQKVEYEFLVKLREIRSALRSQGSSLANSKEMEALRLENEQLKRRNAKLEYRVQHVVANLEKLYTFRDDTAA